jgi:hypothetical protein
MYILSQLKNRNKLVLFLTEFRGNGAGIGREEEKVCRFLLFLLNL